MRLPEPRPAVRRALAVLPHRPGVYLMRDEGGRVLYIGRSGDLATRTRSYWRDLRDRRHLVRMLPRVEWLEPVVCASEHEAAFLESDLLARHRSRYNRTLGMESCVWLRLDSRTESAGLEVVHEPEPRDGARWFGPYLGWEPVRQAAAGRPRGVVRACAGECRAHVPPGRGRRPRPARLAEGARLGRHEPLAPQTAPNAGALKGAENGPVERPGRGFL